MLRKMEETKTISPAQKSRNSLKKKNNKRDIKHVQVKSFVVAFYARYDRMMAKLSHE